MKTLAHIFTSAIFTTLVVTLGATSALAYTDIDSSDRHYDEINYFESLELITDSAFDADKEVTKSEFVKILLDKNGFDASSIDEYPVNFEDVEGDIKPYVEQMRKLGIVIYTPHSNKFKPDSTISLRKALEMYMKYDGVPVPKIFDKDEFGSKVRNIGSDAFFAPLFARAVKLGLVEARNKNIDVFAPLTRRQLAYMIYHGDGLQQKFENASGTPVKKNVVVNVSNVSSSLARESSFKVFEDVWEKILKYYYDKDSLDKQDLLYGAIEGLVKRLDDPYSAFLEPELNNQFSNSLSNEIEGIGASLTTNENGKIEVVSPLSGSPAEKAGMLPGDIITMVNGTSVENLVLTDVISRIKGSSGTKVDITVSRNGTSKTFSITRAKIRVPNVTTEITSDNVAILKIRNFGAGTVSEVSRFIEGLNASYLRGMIIDLRNNPGGYLNSAVGISEHFTGKGESIVQIQYADRSRKKDVSKVDGKLKNEKIAVLINGGSASAAEILAAALRDSAGAVLFGETTYGKGTVQELTGYQGNASLKLTIAHWLTPEGRDVNGIGIVPDVKVSTSDADRLVDNDPVLNRALIYIR